MLGASSCALFVVSALAFLHWWARLGSFPVLRGATALTPLTGFLESWTRVFVVAALAGIVLGALGTWRGSRPRSIAVAGLLLNLGALVLLLVLTSTGTFPPDQREWLQDVTAR
jgi:hypothetical protein